MDKSCIHGFTKYHCYMDYCKYNEDYIKEENDYSLLIIMGIVTAIYNWSKMP